MEEYRRLCRWEDSIKVDIKIIDVDVRNWMELDENRYNCRGVLTQTEH